MSKSAYWLVKKRVMRGVGANAYGQLVTIAVQLLSVPLFLHYWGVDTYGEWILLSAIPAYLSLSDVGFSSVAGNRMAMLIAKEDQLSALGVYQSGWLLILIISTFVWCIVAVTLNCFNPANILGIKFIQSKDVPAILWLLASQVLISLQGGMLSAGFRSIGKYSTGVICSTTTRLGEWTLAALALVSGGGAVHIALAFLSARLVGTFISWLILRKEASWLSIGFSYARKQVISELLKPSIAFMAFPIGLALSLQGVVIVIGLTLGAASVTLFTLYRTLSRLLIQVATTINQAVWAEISVAYGKDNFELMQKLNRKSYSFSFWFGLVGVLVVGLLGDFLIKIWTHSSVSPNSTLLWILLAGAYVNMLWQSNWVLLMATNNHSRISVAFVITSVLTLLSAYAFASFGIESMAAVAFVTELPIFMYAVRGGVIISHDAMIPFLISPFGKLGRGYI